jgi:hypothetical protein
MRCPPSSTSSTSRGCFSWVLRLGSGWGRAPSGKRCSGGSGSAVADVGWRALALVLIAGCEPPPESSEWSQPVPQARSVAVADEGPGAGEAPRGAGPSAGGRARGGAAPGAKTPPSPTLPMLGTDLDQDAILERLQHAPVRLFEPVGRTSVVFRMELRDTVDAAFKPRTRQHPWGYKAEVAAYRLARLLGMDNVPPAVTRRVSAKELRGRLDADFQDTWDEILRWTLWDEDAQVTGAAIYWIPGLRDLGLDQPASNRQVLRWLSQGRPVPEGRRPLTTDLATMIAFDYLIGNWDRWSGANVQGTRSGKRLFIRDHNVAFASPLPGTLHRRIRNHLVGAERFPRGFVERLARMGERDVRKALVEDPGHATGAPILSDAQIADLMDRRQGLLSYIGSLVQAYGEANVLDAL